MTPCLEDRLEEEMTTHSSILAWRIPWSEEPGGLQSVGSQRVGHNLVTEHTHSYFYNYYSPSWKKKPLPHKIIEMYIQYI